MIDQLLKTASEVANEGSKEEREGWPSNASLMLYRYWQKSCPLIYASNSPAARAQPWEECEDERKISEELIHPLVAMFYNGKPPKKDEEGSRKESSLKALSKAVGLEEEEKSTRLGQICGKVFRNGEATYTCRECAHDGTCVLCYDCFINSVHSQHKYKPYSECEVSDAHLPGLGLLRLLSTIPLDIQFRFYALSLAAVRFAVNTLCWRDTSRPPPFLRSLPFEKPEDKIATQPISELFQTVLFNDETHTYEGVIRALTRSIDCNNEQAARVATIVDKEGRAIVKVGTMEQCEMVKQNIEQEYNRRTQRSGPLEVNIYTSQVLGYQKFALRLLRWLTEQAQSEFPLLGAILSNVLLYDCFDDSCEYGYDKERYASAIAARTPSQNAGVGNTELACIATSRALPCLHRSNCVKIILQDKQLWKAAREGFHRLLMASVLMDTGARLEFGRIFVSNYEKLYQEFIEDDHEHSISILSMAVQLFTVPTLARTLIREENAIEITLTTVNGFCAKYVAKGNEKLSQLDFSADSYPYKLRRVLYAFVDLSYLLTSIPKSGDWDAPLRASFIRGGSEFLAFLRVMQGMDGVKRQQEEHQLMDPEWETAFNIFIQCQESLSLLLAWARTDASVHMAMFKRCLSEIKLKVDAMPEFASGRRVKRTVNNMEAYCIDFDVSRSSLSVHQPLWRFLAGLFTANGDILQRHYAVDTSAPSAFDGDGHLNEANINKSDGDFINMRGIRSLLMEMPLRMLVLNAQSNANLWRRNGFSLMNQLHNYTSHLCRTEMYDRDIVLLQAVAAMMEPNKFLIRMLDRFSLCKWAEVGFENLPAPIFPDNMPSTSSSTAEEMLKSLNLLAEDMYHLLIILLGERYQEGVGNCTPETIVEREVLHCLATGPKPFSQLSKVVPNNPMFHNFAVEPILSRIAQFKQPVATSAGLFTLKAEQLPGYNPFFYHYSKQMLSQAEQTQKKERKNLGRELIACPPPQPPPFCPFFKGVTRLMDSDLFIQLISIVLDRTLNRKSQCTTQGLFHRALFLTAMALNEQQRANSEGEPFNFFPKAEAQGLTSLLNKLHTEGLHKLGSSTGAELSEYADLLWWVVVQCKKLSSKRRIGSEDLGAGAIPAPDVEMEEKRADLAARKKELAKEWMKKRQQDFSARNREFLQGGKNKAEGQTLGATEMNVDEGDSEEEEEFMEHFPVCLGPNKTAIAQRSQRKFTCVLCQEEELLSFHGEPMVYAGFAQRSHLFLTGPHCAELTKMEAKRRRGHWDVFDPIWLGGSINITTCSHVIHYKCYVQFTKSISDRESSRPRLHSIAARVFDFNSGEFPCPLCKRLSNCALPLLPTSYEEIGIIGFSQEEGPEEPFEQWVGRVRKLLLSAHLSSTMLTDRASRKRAHSERSTQSSKTSATLSPRHSIGPSEDNVASFSSTSSNESEVGDDSEEGDPSSLSILENLMRYASHLTGGSDKKQKGGETNEPATLAKHWQVVGDFLVVLGRVTGRNATIFTGTSYTPTKVMESMDVIRGCTFTLRSIAAILLEERKPLFGATNRRQMDSIHALVRLSSIIPFNCRPAALRTLLVQLLSPLLLSAEWAAANRHDTSPNSNLTMTLRSATLKEVKAASKDDEEALLGVESHRSLMELDCLSIAVGLCMCMGWSWYNGKQLLADGDMRPKRKRRKDTNAHQGSHKVPDGSRDELHSIRLALIAHIFQLMSTFDPKQPRDNNASTPDEEPASRLHQLLSLSRSELGTSSPIIQRVREGVVSFLRPLALLYNAITGVRPPEALKDPSLDEFAPLCRYLGLPTDICQLLGGSEVETLFMIWKQQTVPLDYKTAVSNLTLPIKPKSLVALPQDYSELINLASKIRCPSLKGELSSVLSPAMCLLCGEILCAQSYCCQRRLGAENVGACNYHMSKCGGGSCGLFLRIRECTLMLLTTYKRGCQRPAPYADEFGENDFGFKRGNPLFLNKELYGKEVRLWMHQEVGEEVVSRMELDHRNLSFEWRHF